MAVICGIVLDGIFAKKAAVCSVAVDCLSQLG